MPPDPRPAPPLAILLVSGQYDRAHAAFMLATAAAAIGRQVTLFATNAGCHALADWTNLQGNGRTALEQDSETQAAGVASLQTLREAAIDLDITLLACDSALRLLHLPPTDLVPPTQITGLPTFLTQTTQSQLATF